jgi:hypothetical protein
VQSKGPGGHDEARVSLDQKGRPGFTTSLSIRLYVRQASFQDHLVLAGSAVELGRHHHPHQPARIIIGLHCGGAWSRNNWHLLAFQCAR